MNRDDTSFLRFIAICFVFNSHLDSYYPIAQFGTGGSIGNALFFMLSAYGLFLSEKRRPQSFRTYLAKRIKRIFPSVWIVLIVITLPLQLSYHPMTSEKMLIYFSKFINPPYWFIKALMIYYLIGFTLIKNYSQKKIIWVFASASAAYLFAYIFYLDLTIYSVETMPFNTIFYGLVFLLGIFLSARNEKIGYAGISDIVIFFMSFLVLYGHKFLITKGMGSNVQIVQHLATLVLIFYALKISRSPMIQGRIMQLPAVGSIIRYISRITLELYIVHMTISPLILRQKLPFPMNAIALLGVSVLLAAIVNQAAAKITGLRYFDFARQQTQ